MIDKVLFNQDNEVFKDYIFEEKESNSLEFKKINIFVGENNSGKSRFLREVFKLLRLRETSKEGKNPPTYLDNYIRDKNKVVEMFDNFFNILRHKHEKNFNASKSLISNFSNKIKNIETDKISYSNYKDIINEFGSFYHQAGNVNEFKEVNDLGKEILDREKAIIINFSYSTFIPVLRSLKKIRETGILQQRVFLDYFQKQFDHDESIFTGENLYKTVDLLKGSPDEISYKIESFEQFVQEQFFPQGFNLKAVKYKSEKDKEGKIAPNSEEDLYVRIGTVQKSITELGDGILALIILLFPLFENQDKNHILFIDEPELNLHPGMQRLFLETLMDDRFENTQVFMCTHSNHLLNISTEHEDKISVFSFKKKEDKFLIENVSNRAHQALELLGVHNSSIFTANCTIWIEGITDRLYIKKYLEVYLADKKKMHLKEDFHYAFVEYSGSNIVHWSFENDESENINAKKVANKIFLVADSDFNSKGEIPKAKKERFEKLEKQLSKKNFHLLPCKEIENTLSKQVLERVLTKFNKNTTITISSNSNYEKTNLGEWIDTNAPIKGKVFKKDNSINYKLDFCRKAVESIDSIDDLSDSAKELCEEICLFIEKHNK